MLDDLRGKTALVTGGSRGIGRAVALALARAGADVAVNYHARRGEAERVCEEIRAVGRRALPVGADVSQAEAVAGMVVQVKKQLGPVELLVNNAGIAKQRALDEVDEALWQETLAVNLTSVFLVTRAVLPDMRARRWGRVVNLASVAAQVGGVVGPHYAASKGGVIGLTHAYASLLVKEGITVNAVAPAFIATDMVADLPNASPDSIPMGRFGQPGEVAEAVLALLANGFVTGQTMNVNGGRYMS